MVTFKNGFVAFTVENEHFCLLNVNSWVVSLNVIPVYNIQKSSPSLNSRPRFLSFPESFG